MHLDQLAVVRPAVPESLDTPGAWAIEAISQVSHAVEDHLWGHTDGAYTPAEALSYLRNQRYATRVGLLAIRPATVSGEVPQVLGVATAGMMTTSNEHLAWLDVMVDPAQRRSGVGSALLAEAERVAAEHGRSTLVMASAHPGEPPADAPGVLEPPTGSGRVSAHDAGAAFALQHGYQLEQAERYSVLQLPPAPGVVEQHRAEAESAVGPDYRLHSWSGRTPEEWVTEMAHLNTRMSTDAPSAGLDFEEVPWDAARLRAREEEIADAGHGYLLVAAEHRPTGRLAGFTMVEWPRDKPEVVEQGDTLVLAEHRGRRLGMLLKTALLMRLAEQRPTSRRIHTWNAEENQYMLAINVALGFRPAGVYAMWQKR